MTVFWLLALLVTAVAAGTDLRTGHIPNWLTGGAFALALAVHAVAAGARGGAAGAAVAVAWSLAGALACVAPLALLFVKGALGGGDIKLFAALGALVHPMHGLEIEVHAFVVAAVLAVGQIVHRGALLATLARSARLVGRVLGGRGRRSPRAEDGAEDGAPAGALPPALLSWYRLGPSIFAGALFTWWLRRG